MKKYQFLFFLIVLAMCNTHLYPQTIDERNQFRNEVESDLTGNILPFWMEHMIDPDGGFYGSANVEGNPNIGSDKGSILNARIIWTFSKAFRHYGFDSYRKTADRAAGYFIDHFIDPKYGGVVWSLDSEGRVKDYTKQTYATAFGIYGLAEHFQATGNRRSLQAAIGLFRTLEEHVHDQGRQGYIEAFSRDWTPTKTLGVDRMAGATKTMNTHIHLMEALTTLYQVWPDSTLRERLYELLDILQRRLYSPESKHLILFCTDDWEPIGHVDSYGHDIETSWLLCEAAEVLGDKELLAKIRKQSVEMVDVALSEGMTPEGLMRYEKTESGISGEKSWWPQCETVIGCINAWQITGERKYYDNAVKTWNYIKEHFIDNRNGGWFKYLDGQGRPLREDKASMWNCPYHNSRVAYELNRRLLPETVHTEVMAWSNITGVRVDGELIDFESTLRVGTPGGKIESTGREKQNGVRYRREGPTQSTQITMKEGTRFSQTVTDVDETTVKLAWEVTGGEKSDGSAYFCMSFASKLYSDSKIKISGKKVTVKTTECYIELVFDRNVKSFVREEEDGKVLFVTLMQDLANGRQSELNATMKVDCQRHHEDVSVSLDITNPGRVFAGFGGNFRIQNSLKDPEVIDYCLNNMRVAFGRVEMPWSQWDQFLQQSGGSDTGKLFGKTVPAHILESAETAQRLKREGIPVIVSCWFPPRWACNSTTRSDGTSFAYSLKPEMHDRIYESLASYLLYLKREWGVEADYFSFNESDLGINIVHTPEEHRDFIKGFGQYMASLDFKTRMLLGDNSDATTFDFIVPTLNDPSAHKYVGAISFHSWRGCDDETLGKWAAAARKINVPLIIGEGSTDAAAHQYASIFNETTFALYEINLYTRICAICQPLSILQWQLTSDYSILWGDGIYGSEGPLRPTQRFWNLKQLSMTPEKAFSIPTVCDKDNINTAAFYNPATGLAAVHIVNNAASCHAVISGLPESASKALVRITSSDSNSESRCIEFHDGKLKLYMPADSFVSIFIE
ncbi:MAG: AGE family epimerase/isomerase [Bacteroidaceae bacterium]|nr:AGE family epimerase/isomerase [Bacteroidaceae bacterium]